MRGGAVQPDFALSERNAVAVALVCHRLDGIPLAPELAAARIEALSAEQIAARLDQRFRGYGLPGMWSSLLAITQQLARGGSRPSRCGG